MPVNSVRSMILRSAAVAALVVGSSVAMAQAPAGGAAGGAPGPAGGAGGPAAGAGGPVAPHGGGTAPGNMSPGAGGADRAAPRAGAGTGEGGARAPAAEKGRPGAAEQGDKTRNNADKNGGEKGVAGERSQHDGGAAGHGGPAGGAGRAHLGGEQRTRFRNVIREHHVEPLHGVDFAVRDGSIIPERYHFYPLPPELIELVPEYRGYDYVVVDDKIIILEPGTRRIVDIIED